MTSSCQPFIRFAVGRDDGRGGLVAFDDDFVEVGGLGGVEGLDAEVVDDQQWDVGQAAHLGFDGVIQPRGLEAFEQLVRAGHVRADAAADSDVPEGGAQVT